MTATRWWVRLAARWFAKIKTTEGQLRSLSLAVTAFSTFSLVLQNAGLGQFVPVVGAIAACGWVIYSHLYSEGGVHNQAQRDLADLSNNYAGPSSRINNELTGRAVAAAMKGDSLTQGEREAMQEELDAAFSEYRDGIVLEE